VARLPVASGIQMITIREICNASDLSVATKPSSWGIF
jgi:hypothetical protein